MPEVIGGEIGVDLKVLRNKVSFDIPREHLLTTGRVALYEILRYFQRTSNSNTVFIPDYICHSVIHAARKAGFEIEIYDLNDRLEGDANSFRKAPQRGDVVLLVNYFGMTNTMSLIEKDLVPEGVFLVLDNVQGFYELDKHLSKVDFSFSSLRKSFGVPAGAPVFTEKHPDFFNLEAEEGDFESLKLLGGILKSTPGIEDRVFLDYLDRGETLIERDYQSRCVSELTYELIRRQPYEEIQERRRENASYVYAELKKLGIQTILPFKEEFTPLFVPIKLRNRNECRKDMFRSLIFSPIHWPKFPDIDNFPTGKEMGEKELSLIIDQRYSKEHLDRILELLKHHSE